MKKMLKRTGCAVYTYRRWAEFTFLNSMSGASLRQVQKYYIQSNFDIFHKWPYRRPPVF